MCLLINGVCAIGTCLNLDLKIAFLQFMCNSLMYTYRKVGLTAQLPFSFWNLQLILQMSMGVHQQYVIARSLEVLIYRLSSSVFLPICFSC